MKRLLLLLVSTGIGTDSHGMDIIGEPVVRDGKLLKADEGAIMRKAAVAARKIWSIAADRKILPPPPVGLRSV
jgi:hypothetical protein